jgi:glycosyltransferase involved in cell wall biosynthesis
MSDQPATIAHVLHRLEHAGAEVLAADLSRKLQGEYHFVFLCLDQIGHMGRLLQEQGFTVVNLGRRPGLDVSVARRIRRAVRYYGIDLLHAHQYSPFFYASLSRGLFGRKRGGRPLLLFTEHGRHYPDQRRLKRVLANRWLLRPGDRVTAVGRFVRRMLIENEGLDIFRLSHDIQVIYNGIDQDRFAPGPGARQAARKQLGVADDQFLVMQVARFHSVKDHGTGLLAFARAHNHMPNFRLALVGDGQLKPAMEQRAWDLGVFDHVQFLGVREDVNQLLPAADIFMLSSLSEGISITLLEAMAAQLPIVATDVGGNAEVIEHGQTGLLSPRQDADTLAQNLLLLGNADMRQKMGAAGRVRVIKQFTQLQMHAAYADVYDQMLAG